MQDQYWKLVDFISFSVSAWLRIIVYFVVSTLTKDIVEYWIGPFGAVIATV